MTMPTCVAARAWERPNQRGKPGPWESGDFAAVNQAIFQVLAGRTKASILGTNDTEALVSRIGPKRPRLRLDPQSYRQLCRQVLLRDGWRCQVCGTMSNLEVHHRQYRSQSGDDSEQNLITLCARCHTKLHLGPQRSRTRTSSPRVIA